MLRLAEARVGGIQLLECALVARQPKEVVLLLEPLQLQGRVVRAVAVDDLALRLELVVADAEPAGVGALVDVTRGLRPPHHLGRRARMVRIGGPDEAVVADAEAVEPGAPARCPVVDQQARLRASLTRLALEVCGVLVHSREEADVPPQETVIAGDHVRADGLEHRVQRGCRARIEDRGGQVVRVAHQCSRPFGQYSSLRTCSVGKPRSMAISSTADTMSGLPHR